MSPFQRAYTTTLAVIALLSAGFLAGFVTHDRIGSSADDFPILTEAYDLILNQGLPTPPAAPALEYGMIRGMIQAYGDPYTSFVEPAQHELNSQNLEGSYGGIGATIEKDPEGYFLLFPFPDGPARLAGIQDGDRLLQVDDLVLTPDTAQDILLAAIRGPIGEEVTITISRTPGYQAVPFKIKRAEIALPSVTWRLAPDEPRLGLIKVNIIAASTAEEIQKAVADLQERGATHFALDLRDNYGGLLDAGVEIARLFLAEGIVIQQQYRGKDVETIKVEDPGVFFSLPLVVLVNQNTASAAEIIAGALQGQQRAPLIGVPTYGKDAIQLVFLLQDESSLHVTAARWWAPGLEQPVGDAGLQPDILLAADSPGSDPAVQAAIQHFFSP
ncbi:MAG TPA: S41 family peptidase [Anaerolineales bacterium]|nr:S41 family peptidase [Anaerolineales bacterium]